MAVKEWGRCCSTGQRPFCCRCRRAFSLSRLGLCADKSRDTGPGEDRNRHPTSPRPPTRSIGLFLGTSPAYGSLFPPPHVSSTEPQYQEQDLDTSFPIPVRALDGPDDAAPQSQIVQARPQGVETPPLDAHSGIRPRRMHGQRRRNQSAADRSRNSGCRFRAGRRRLRFLYSTE
jgi:hypothetical protein